MKISLAVLLVALASLGAASTNSHSHLQRWSHLNPKSNLNGLSIHSSSRSLGDVGTFIGGIISEVTYVVGKVVRTILYLPVRAVYVVIRLAVNLTATVIALIRYGIATLLGGHPSSARSFLNGHSASYFLKEAERTIDNLMKKGTPHSVVSGLESNAQRSTFGEDGAKHMFSFVQKHILPAVMNALTED